MSRKASSSITAATSWWWPGHKRRAQEILASNGTLTQLAIEANESELFVSALSGENGSGVWTIAYPFQPSGMLSQLLQEPPSRIIQGMALSNGQTF
ncbi:MAG: hypothetical protein WBW76_05245 [Candidatus Cybelea sp.]